MGSASIRLSAWGMVSSNPTVQKYIPEQTIEQFKAEMDKDAKAMSNEEADAFFKKIAAEPKFKGIQEQVINELESELDEVNQKSRNKALLAALLAVGILGILGFILSLMLPGGAPGKPRKKHEKPAKQPTAGT